MSRKSQSFSLSLSLTLSLSFSVKCQLQMTFTKLPDRNTLAKQSALITSGVSVRHFTEIVPYHAQHSLCNLIVALIEVVIVVDDR